MAMTTAVHKAATPQLVHHAPSSSSSSNAGGATTVSSSSSASNYATILSTNFPLIMSLSSGADDSPPILDLNRERTIKNWRQLLSPSIRRVLDHIGMDATQEAFESLQNESLDVLRKIIAPCIKDVRERVHAHFQPPMDRYAFSRAEEVLTRAANYLHAMEVREEQGRHNNANQSRSTRQAMVSKLKGVKKGSSRSSSSVGSASLTTTSALVSDLSQRVSLTAALGQTVPGLSSSSSLLGNQSGTIPDSEHPFMVVSFLLAVLEYALSELLKLTGNFVKNYVKNTNRTTITDEDIKISMCIDHDVMRIFRGNQDDDDYNELESHHHLGGLHNGGDLVISPVSIIGGGLEDLDTASIHKRRTLGHAGPALTYEGTIRELLKQEKEYIKDLQLLIKVFRDPLVKLLPLDIVDEDERLESIFSNIDEIYDLAVSLVGSLEDTLEATQENEAPTIGLCFEELVETADFDNYFRYASEHLYNADTDERFSCRNALLRILSRDGVIDSIKRAGHGKHFHLSVKYMLPKMLIWPVCHCFQYFEYVRILSQLTPSADDRESFLQAEAILKPLKTRLEDLVSKLPPPPTISSTTASSSSSSSSTVQNSNAQTQKRSKLSEHALRLNRLQISRAETRQKMAEVQKSVEGLQLSQVCQEFIMEGPLKKSSKGGLMSERYAFLFDGQLVLCKPKELTSKQRSSIMSGQTNPGNLFDFRCKETLLVATIEINDMEENTTGSCQSPNHTSSSANNNNNIDLSDTISMSSGMVSSNFSSSQQSAASMNSLSTNLTGSKILSDSNSTLNMISTASSGGGGHGPTSTLSSLSAASLNFSFMPSAISSAVRNGTLNPNQAHLIQCGFEISRPHGPKIILFAPTRDEKVHWMAHIVNLATRTMLGRTLESIQAEEEKNQPLKLPPVDMYRFSEPDSDYNIVIEEKETSDSMQLIKGATLTKLVERLTFHQAAQPTFAKTFLVTYRSFCTPAELLGLLMERFNIPEPPIDRLYSGPEFLGENGEYLEAVRNAYREDLKKFRKHYAQPVRFRVVNVLKQWVIDHFYDFEREPPLLEKLVTFLETEVRNCTVVKMPRWVDPLMRVIERKRRNMMQLEYNSTLQNMASAAGSGSGPTTPNDAYRASQQSPCSEATETESIVTTPPGIPASSPTTSTHTTTHTFSTPRPPIEHWIELSSAIGMNILTMHPIEVGRQLTLIQFDLFKALKPSELVDAAWTKSKSNHRTAPNLLRITHDNTNFIYWIEKTIVEADNFDERVAIMTRFLEIMVVFMELNNFNGIMAIVSAFNSACVHRLEQTRSHATHNKVLKRAWEDAKELCDRAQNFKNLKDKLRSINPPCVPFCGMYLTYLVAINDGNPDYILSRSAIQQQSQRAAQRFKYDRESTQALANGKGSLEGDTSGSSDTQSPTGILDGPGDGEVSPTDTQATITSLASVSTVRSSSSTLTDGTLTVYSEDAVSVRHVDLGGGLGGFASHQNTFTGRGKKGELINFNKRRKVAEIIAEIQQYQNQPYNLEREESISGWLRKNIQTLHEIDRPVQTDSAEISEKEKKLNDYLYNKSLEIEPRPKSGEKRAILPNFPRKYPDLTQPQIKGPGIKGLRSSRTSMNPSTFDNIRHSLSIGNIEEHPSHNHYRDGSMSLQGFGNHSNPTHSPSTPLTPPLSATSTAGGPNDTIFANVFIGGGSGSCLPGPSSSAFVNPPSTPMQATPPTPGGVFSAVTIPQHSRSNVPPPLPLATHPITPPALPPRTHTLGSRSRLSSSSAISPQAMQAPGAPLLPPREADECTTSPPPLPPRTNSNASTLPRHERRGPPPALPCGTLPNINSAGHPPPPLSGSTPHSNVNQESTHFRFFPGAATGGRRHSSNDFTNDPPPPMPPPPSVLPLAGPPVVGPPPAVIPRRQSSNSQSSTPPLSPMATAVVPVLPPKTYKQQMSNNGSVAAAAAQQSATNSPTSPGSGV